MSKIDLPVRPRILVVVLRRIGDVLLTTPLIGSLRQAWPDATIDALVFADTAGILNGNPHLSSVLTMPARRRGSESLVLAARLLRRYDLAISTQLGDRPTFFTWVAGRRRVGFVQNDKQGALRRRLFDRWVEADDRRHRVEDVLRLADAIGIDRVSEVTGPAPLMPPGIEKDYVVIHAAPMFRYKQWTEDGWRQLAAALAQRGLAVVATGGPSSEEKHYLDRVWGPLGGTIDRRDGATGWAELAGLLSRASVYVGPDTSVTHLAAANGCPTVAIYGPTDPRLWGPWPVGGLPAPWSAAGTIQRRGNVWLVQNPLPCLPCQREGCEGHLTSFSQCLDELLPGQVLAAADQALASRDKKNDAGAAPCDGAHDQRSLRGAPDRVPVRP